MTDGWLLDITESPDGLGVELWLKDAGTGRVGSQSVPFRPPFLVEGAPDALQALRRDLERDDRVETLEWTTLLPAPQSTRRRKLLSVTPRRNRDRRSLATEVDRRGGFVSFVLYDVDLAAPQRYHLANGLYPFAPVRFDGRDVRATEPAETIEYPFPPLRIAPLEVRLKTGRRGGIVPADDRIAGLRLGPAELDGPEEPLLRALVAELDRQDPDILLTEGGDGFDLPWLYRRAASVGLGPGEFRLGRAPSPFGPARRSRSFETYGRIRYTEATYPLAGRFHLDEDNSFLFEDARLEGLVDAARLSRLSLQTISRQSPGTCFTAMEMACAHARGLHVPWKKNRPEEFKSARTLLASDRGGVIFLPPVGVHSGIEEFDFASLYPQIMVRHNLSAETLDCRCCPASPHVAPGLGYRSCVRRVGLLPDTLRPLLARRSAYKAAAKDPTRRPEERARYKLRAKMLKWILVTAFGYQGYRNARFGRIECHEAINAYARELIARLVPIAEAAGYEVLHGIVDSLWLRPRRPEHPPDPEAFARDVTDRMGLPLGVEGRYRWILFLPATTHGLGVPNRYYGRYESGEFKLRGIGSRRHDTPLLLRRFEGEILEILGRAADAGGVWRRLPQALARARLFAAAISRGDWPVEELLLAHRVSQPEEGYATFTDTTAALRQLAERGHERAPGETVRYVVLDRRSRSFRDRVRVAELVTGREPYDVGAYLELLARSAETLLAPLGVTRDVLLAEWGVPEAPPRDRYRSPEGRRQRQLDDGAATATP